jgi:lipopolysaccharide/colanic/teichoic acid biosynthesis glycosyltransferase
MRHPSEKGVGVRVKTVGLPRWAEVALAAAGVVLTFPLVVAAAVAMRISSAGPVLFTQQRVGRNGVLFALYKLRTMRSVPGPQITSDGDPRITWSGAIIRRAKVDELPGLWNVLRGEMRLVGPRPEVPSHVDVHNPMWAKALEVAPGLTDPTTQLLRDEERILKEAEDPDLFYRRHLQPFKLRGYLSYQEQRTWRTDLAVLCSTVLAVFRVKNCSRQPSDLFREIKETSTPWQATGA